MNKETKILIVEDDNDIAKLLQRLFSSEGFVSDCVNDGETAVTTIIEQQPDVVILDLMLPKLDGIEVCQQVRPHFKQGIIMLTARDDELNETIALNAGIDDYLCKPVRPHILLARVNALLRRLNQGQEVQELHIQNLRLDRRLRQVYRNNEVLEFSDSEFELLWLLGSSAGQVVNREVLFTELRGVPYDGLDRSVDMRVSQLRKRLQHIDPEREYIRTLRGIGYVLVEA